MLCTLHSPAGGDWELKTIVSLIIRLSCRKLFRKKDEARDARRPRRRRKRMEREVYGVLAVAVTPLLYTYEMDVAARGGNKMDGK